MELDTGRPWGTPLRNSLPDPQTETRYAQRLQEATDRIEASQKRQKSQHDRMRKGGQWRCGQKVLLNTHSLTHALTHKLRRPWAGPFEILETYPNGTVKLKMPEGSNIFDKFFEGRLKPYKGDASVENIEPRYLMEAIDGERYEDGIRKYLVRWVGYSQKTWEPEDVVLEAQGKDLIDDYHARWNRAHPSDPFL